MAERIVFPDVPPRPNFKRRCIEFPAELGAKKLLCLATAELLVERFEARDFTEEEILRAYEKYRPRLQAIARSQIRAGKISPNFEVLLTTESFALKEVKFSDGVRESPYYFQLARQVTAELEEVVKTSAPFVTVE